MPPVELWLRAPGELLRRPVALEAPTDEHLFGFGGLHGGLALGLLTSAMHDQAPGTRLLSATAQYHRAVRAPAVIAAWPLRAGRSMQSFAARLADDEQVFVTASAMFAPAGQAQARIGPAMPAVPSAGACEPFPAATEFVPFAAHTEIRLAGSERPFAGGSVPVLTAWIRFVEDDDPPDEHRLAVIFDSLAPSLAATQHSLAAMPTVELTVRPAAALAAATSPWVLVRARTHALSAEGWIDEHLDAWAPTGEYFGSAQQLRLAFSRG